MIKARKIELLAPARNLECGIEAVKHGADAVYIGAPKFGARSAAGNSIDDIAKLVSFAHLYNVRIYVAVNVILKDEELSEVQSMIEQLYSVNVDALIIQDLALLQLNLPPIPLHASTQLDNRTSEKVDFWDKAGLHQVVLARELSLSQIRQIHAACPQVILESFVHGALCVSSSGQCYASQACFGRSANRGECAQFCRLAFDMVDADEKVIIAGKHLLSLKDLNLSDRLEELLDAGVSSLKIEGRLKDVSYIKNITAYYRQKLDAIFARRAEYVRASTGKSTYTFKPQPDKSFNRGFTHYLFDGRGEDIAAPDSPKSMGELMGTMKESRGSYITVAGLKPFHNGDGVCYLDEKQHLHGFKVNKVDNNRLYPQGGSVPYIKPHTPIYRNSDQEFERILSNPSAERKIKIQITFDESASGFSSTMSDEDGNSVTLALNMTKEKARSSQRDRLQEELGKLGNTPFEAEKVDINMLEDWFIPMSAVADLRRRMVDELIRVRHINYPREVSVIKPTAHPFPEQQLTYLGNVMNEEAARFYRLHGVTEIAPAFEKQQISSVPLMFCKNCLRFNMGWCPTHQSEKSPYREPYYLVLPDSRRFRLDFDCKNCQMKVIAV